MDEEDHMVRIAIYMRLSKEDEKDCRKEEATASEISGHWRKHM